MKKIISMLVSVMMASIMVMPINAESNGSTGSKYVMYYSDVTPRSASRNVSKSYTTSINYIGLTYKVNTTVSGTIFYASSGAVTDYSLGVSGSWVSKPSDATIMYKNIGYSISGANVIASYTVGIKVGNVTTWALEKSLIL